MKQGEIWLVSYLDGVGHEYQKNRPALIIVSDKQINKTNVYTVIPLTSKSNKKVDDDILVNKDDNNNLFCDSLLKTHHIQSFDKSRFIKIIGNVDDKILNKVKSYLKIHFNL